jgi:uncharacterized membrane protein
LPRALPALVGDISSAARSINDRGEVAGTSFAGPNFRGRTAVLWSSGGRAKALLPLDGDAESTANGISNRGDVVGTSTRPGRRTAVVWNRRGEPQELLPLAGDMGSEASGINARGEVVGTSFPGPGFQGSTAVVWR